MHAPSNPCRWRALSQSYMYPLGSLRNPFAKAGKALPLLLLFHLVAWTPQSHPKPQVPPGPPRYVELICPHYTRIPKTMGGRGEPKDYLKDYLCDSRQSL
jgi:hypothetical protein